MMMEPHRSRYLRALGIDLYVPRQPLPGAASSVPVAWDLDDTPGADEAASISSNVRAPLVAITETLPSARPALPTLEPRSRPASQEPAPASVERSQGNTPRFALLVVRCDCGVVVVDDGARGMAQGNEYLRLLNNLLFALYRRPVAIESDPFVWPMVKNPGVDQSEQAARESLGAYLQRQCSRVGGNTLVALGNGASQWMQADPAFRVVAGISLWRCLEEATAKRTLWQQLEPLRAAQS